MTELGRVESRSPEEQHYHQAKADPIATVILDALYEQDAKTYHGDSGDKGGLALRVAEKLRESIAWEIIDNPGPDPSPANPTWWAGWTEGRLDAAKVVRDLIAPENTDA